MEHRRTPPVLRRTQPELLADGERSRRARRLWIGVGLAGVGLVAGAGSAVTLWHDGLAASAVVGLAIGLGVAAVGLVSWLRAQ